MDKIKPGLNGFGKWISTALLVFAMTNVYGQTDLNFTGISATPDGAVQLTWNSVSNEYYEIDEADALGTNSDGSTAWHQLYTEYPAQGTNTMWQDDGNYGVVPAIVHPRFAGQRYYRIVYSGTNTAANPTVAVTNPASGSVLSGQVTVSVAGSSSLPVLTTKLFVDGQQMDPSDDGTNWVINTCEWPNGPHTLFATATADSDFSGASGVDPIYTGRGVSPFVPVTFSNLISQIEFSQPFFEPSLSETQVVTALFDVPCDWTLQIQDENTNTVRTVTGSGSSMSFAWDGTGDGETNIPDGVYNYVISASTNGESEAVVSGGSVSGGGSPPSPDLVFSTGGDSTGTELWAQLSDGSGVAAPFMIYPPGFNTNSLTIFEAPVPSAASTRPRVRASSSGVLVAGGIAAPAYSGGSSQGTTAPTRPPTAPTKNAAGTFAIGFYSWPTPQTVTIPQNGLNYPATGYIHLDTGTGNSITFDNLPQAQAMSDNMCSMMNRHGWKPVFVTSDQNLHVRNIQRSDQGGSAIFTQANIGLFLDHGDYGTAIDYTAGGSGSKETYFRSDADGNGDTAWLRMGQFGFGGNLKWMAILACNSLSDPNYSTMVSHGAISLNTTHLVCGCDSYAAIGEDIGADWVKYMFSGAFRAPDSVAEAWFKAGHSQYAGATNLVGQTLTFRVAGYSECLSDTLDENVPPSSPSSAPTGLMKLDSQVYP
jgi:hypothetical protein